jgi:hypothetical protein
LSGESVWKPGESQAYVELLGCVQAGKELERSEPSSKNAVPNLGEGEVVEAEAIRDVLVGKKPPKDTPQLPLDPKGIRIHGAWIRGPLNLDGITATICPTRRARAVAPPCSCAAPTSPVTCHWRVRRSTAATSRARRRAPTAGRSPCGLALVADAATIQGDVFLDMRFKATGGTRLDAPSGGSVYAAVRMVETSVGKALLCSGQALRVQDDNQDNSQQDKNKKEPVPALDLRAQLGTWYLSKGFAANENAGQREDGLLSCDGLKYAQRPVLLDGNTPVDGAKQADEWADYLKNHAVYSAQAYQQLAAAFLAQGDDDAARRILIRQCDDARDRGGLSPLNKFWQGVLRLLVGYGYRSVKALYWLAGLFACIALLAVLWFGPFGLIQPVSTTSSTTSTSAATSTTTTSTTKATHCSFTAQLSYAIDVAFPIITISSSSEQQCDVASPNPNQLLVAFGWLVRALSATLLAIYVAGLTGLTSRTPGS